jgi:hypothetical protein
MSQPPPADRVRKFQATFKTLADATSFLRRLHGKFGYLGKRGYSCSGIETGGGPATGPITASVSFSPWYHPIDARDSTDFEGILRDANAQEISN